MIAGSDIIDHVVAIAVTVAGAIGGLVVGLAKVSEKVIGKAKFEKNAAAHLEEHISIARDTREMMSSIETHMANEKELFNKLIELAEDNAKSSMEIAALLKAYLQMKH